MYYAILAAGHGSRLKDEGLTTPKPFVKAGDASLLDRLVSLLSARDDSTGLGVILNPDSLRWARENGADASLAAIDHLVSVFTEGSMESLRALAPSIRESGDSHFCLTTVDSVWDAREFSAYLKAFDDQKDDIDGLMAVTSYIDDDSPLWVAVDRDSEITGFRDTPPEDARYVSGGVYLLPMSALDLLDDCHDRGLRRMRDFQRALIANGLRLKAYPFSVIIDVDRPRDLDAARRLFHS